jgi:inner membrane protein
MDSLTHALAGALIGETASRLWPTREGGLSAKRRRAFFVSLGVIGSNLPDMDFIYSAVTRSKLDYLLHHRGHTHTIIGALVAALLMYAVCEAWLKLKNWTASRHDRLGLLVMALIAPLLHITMDSTNTYGVHPFWPWNNHWMYGDSVFIIEPLLWASAVPLLFLLQTRTSRGVGVVLLLTAATWIFSTGMIAPVFGAALIVMTVGLLAVGFFAPARVALITALSSWAAVTLVFIVAHGAAKQTTELFFAGRFPNAQTLDAALSPLPVNPVCWEVVSAHLDGEQYAMRRAILSLAPAWMPAEKCPNRRLKDPTTASVKPVTAPGAAYWKWYGELVIPRDRLANLAVTRCEVAAFMRFSRVPWAEHIKGRWVLGDLRYDREPDFGFSELELNAHERCPAHPPPWIPPRAELLP